MQNTWNTTLLGLFRGTADVFGCELYPWLSSNQTLDLHAESANLDALGQAFGADDSTALITIGQAFNSGADCPIDSTPKPKHCKTPQTFPGYEVMRSMNLLQPVKGSGGVLQYSYYGMLGYAGHYQYPQATIRRNLAALSNITRELQHLAGVFLQPRVALQCGGPAVHTRLFRESNVQAALFASLANDAGTTAASASTLVVINGAHVSSTVRFASGGAGAAALLTLEMAPWGVAIVEIKDASHPRCHAAGSQRKAQRHIIK